MNPENSVVTLPDYETPEQLKAEALEMGSPMTYQAAEYIERYHRLYAKALIEIDAARKLRKQLVGAKIRYDHPLMEAIDAYDRARGSA